MIDRGALVLEMPQGGAYRGVNRPALDAQKFTGRKGRDLAQRYRDAIVAGDGVLEDLDDAIELRAAAEHIGVTGLEVIVFEVPQEPMPRPGALPIATNPPAEGLLLLGWDVIEVLEPFWSPLASPDAGRAVNDHALFPDRTSADAFARTWNEAHADDEPVVAVRIWAMSSVR
jgi:hypothetical protein